MVHRTPVPPLEERGSRIVIWAPPTERPSLVAGRL